jgi:opacity protein-like surface antigen
MLAPTTAGFRSHIFKAGWTMGGGVEARLFGNWTGKLVS